MSKNYNLTCPQKNIWLMEKVYENTNVNTIAGGLVIKSGFKTNIANEVVNKYIETNEAMRLHIISSSDGEPKQSVTPFTHKDYEIIDMTNLSNKKIQEVKQKLIQLPLSLNECMYNYYILDYGKDYGEIFFKANHMVCDAWGCTKMTEQMSKIYVGLENGETSFQNNPSYIDYISSENEYINSARYEQDQLFWSDYLKGVGDSICVKPNIAELNNRYLAKRYEYTLNDAQNSEINEYCKNNKVSAYNVFMAGVAMYTARVNEKKDFIIGTPVLNRSNFNEKQTQGMYISTIPVRISINDNTTFLDLAKDLSRDSFNLFKHSKYPYINILKDCRQKNKSIGNLYKIMLSYQNARSNMVGDGRFTMNWVFPNAAQDEFAMHIVDLNNTGNYSIYLDYICDLFDKQEIKLIASRIIECILDGIKNNSNYDNIKIMTDEEKNDIINTFNDTYMPYEDKETVISIFEKQTKIVPKNVAVVHNEKFETYKGIDKITDRIARNLYKYVTEDTQYIGVIMDKSIDLIATILAILKLGLAYVPIDKNTIASRRNFMLNKSNCKMVITTSDITLEDLNVEKVAYEQLANEKNTIRYVTKPIDADSPVCVLFTSGTTGEPKGVVIRNRGIIKLVRNTNYAAFTPEDKVLQAGAITFDASIFEIWSALLNGGELHMIKKSDLTNPAYLASYLKVNKITILLLTAALFNSMIDINASMFKDLRNMFTGGDALSVKHANKLREACPNITITNCYGPTEATVFTTVYIISKKHNKRIPIGKTIANSKAYVMDSKLRLLPLYVAGEYVLAGESVALGYIGNEELTKEKFVNNYIDNCFNVKTMYKTGDIVQMTADGSVDYIGRVDNQVKIRGYRIELDEIKYVIDEYPTIRDSAVIIKTNDKNEKTILAFIETKANTTTNHLELNKYLKEKLVSYMIPTKIIEINKLPINDNGKIDRNKLLEYEEGLGKSENNYNKKETVQYVGIYKKIYKLFSQVLNTPEISPDDSFFDIGGDSLSAIRLTSLGLSANLEFVYADLYKYPSIQELGDFLLSKKKKQSISEGIQNIDYTNINRLLKKNTTSSKLEIQDIKSVLLIGSTGFLGVHILKELLDKEDASIYCLMRDKTIKEATKRLENKFTYYFGNKYKKLFNQRVKIVLGDVIDEKVFVSSEIERDVMCEITHIINAAAYVKHYGNLDMFDKINHTGAKNVAKLAYENNKELIHISTLSVSGNILEGGRIVQEKIKKGTSYDEKCLYIGQNLDNVYVYTKFMGEKEVYEYILKGLKAKIVRVGNLMGRHLDGVFQQNVEENAFVGRLKSLIELGVVPTNLLEFDVEFSPIDLVAKAVLKIGQVANPYNTYHVYNHNHIKMNQLRDILQECGYVLQIVNKDKMKEILETYLNTSDGQEKIKGIIQDIGKEKELEYEPNTKIHSEFTQSVLKKLKFVWPKVEKKYIKVFIQELERLDYLKGGKK